MAEIRNRKNEAEMNATARRNELTAKYPEFLFIEEELAKTAHRAFTTAYTLGKNEHTVNYDDSQSRGDRTFIALVIGNGSDEKGRYALIEMRNRFSKGDVLEVLSPSNSFNKKIDIML